MNRIAAVVIGRNEGERLVSCLRSLVGRVDHIVYVDSGSTDGSIDVAIGLKAEVIELDTSVPFTAARARNAGFSRVSGDGAFRYVQFVDGDCEIVDNWIETAAGFLDSAAEVAVVAGRLRERYPQSSVYHRLADAEWRGPEGPTEAVGGIMMARVPPLAEAGGFNPDLIAGEEPELCLRLRRAGWKIWRLADDMALHDIAMTRFSQWWTRSKRAGHTYAEGAALYGRGPERYNVDRERRSLIWGAGVPAAALLGALVTPWALLILLAWPAQVVRLRLRGEPWERAVFLTLGKVAEAQGAIGYRLAQWRGRRVRLIEYK
jgi:GT2 family glycosyltransferase